MIRSMTAFGTARAESAEGSVTIEFRTVNSRFLDINFRLPDDLRMAEGIIREKLNQVVTRGKVDIRLNYVRNKNEVIKTLDQDYLAAIAEQLKTARLAIPDIAAPQLSDLIKGSNGSENDTFSPEIWTAMCQQASTDALADLQANREREGQRLAHMMLECAASVSDIVNDVESHLPQLLTEHQEKLANKLREALQAANPGGFPQITGEELSARIAQETALFSLRIDVAEEVARLRSHISELEHLLHTGEATAKDSKAASKPNGGKQGKNNSGSAGKRLDFLFQEMNREANTLGSKASAISVTRAAIDLKLLIEQMREQAQNIE